MTAIFVWFTTTRLGREVGIAIIVFIVVGSLWRWSTNRAFTNGKSVGGVEMSESIRKAKEKEWKAKDDEFKQRETALQQAAKELEEKTQLADKQAAAWRSGVKRDVAGIKQDLNQIPLIVSNIPSSELIPQIKASLVKLGGAQIK